MASMIRFAIATSCASILCAGALAAPSQGWDFRITWDTGSWIASENPGAFKIKQTKNGQTLISGQLTTGGFSSAWDLVLQGDGATPRGAFPFLTSSFNITNASAGSQNFEVYVTLNTFAIGAPTAMYGSISGSVGDTTPGSGSGATVSTWGVGESFYAATIDGAVVRTLHDHAVAVSAGPGGTANIPTMNYGPEGGPGLLGEIGIRNRFTLTAFDNAQMTSTFFVIPAPGAASALAMLGVMGLRRRR